MKHGQEFLAFLASGFLARKAMKCQPIFQCGRKSHASLARFTSKPWPWLGLLGFSRPLFPWQAWPGQAWPGLPYFWPCFWCKGRSSKSIRVLLPYMNILETSTHHFYYYFDSHYTSYVQVEKLRRDVSATKSSGQNILPPQLIKPSAAAIAKPIANIFNASIAQGCYPSAWKMG